MTTNYALDLAAGLTQVLADGNYTYLYGLGRIAQYSAAGTDYFLTDALDSVRRLVDENGNVILAKAYEPFGETLESAGDGESAFAFTGEAVDSTGLVYLRARYYSTCGRALHQPGCVAGGLLPADVIQCLVVHLRKPNESNRSVRDVSTR